MRKNEPEGDAEENSGRVSLRDRDGDTDSDGIFIFGDEDGDNGSGQISYLAFYDSTLTSSDVQALGGPGQQAVPEPATIAALGLGVGAFLRRRAKK